MKIIKIFLLSCFCLSSLSYAGDFFRIKNLSEPIEVRYNYGGHGGMSDLVRIDFELNSSGWIKQVTITNQTVEEMMDKLLKGTNLAEQKNATTSMVINPKDNRDQFFYVSYLMAKGSEGEHLDRNLMVVSGKNELLVSIEFSDGSSSNGIETLDVKTEMYY